MKGRLCIGMASLLAGLLVSCDPGLLVASTAQPPATETPLASTPARPAPPATDIAEVTPEVWDYLALGDSFTGRNYWPEIYASYIEEDLGVEVDLHVRWQSNMNHDRVLVMIRTDQELRELIANAEVISISYDPGTLDAPEASYLLGTCGGDDNEECLRSGVRAAQEDWDAILAEIVALHRPSEALIKTFKIGPWPYPVFYAGRASPEEIEIMVDYFLELNTFVGESAFRHGIAVVDVGEALMGPGYEEPISDEYLQSDRMHLTEQGGKVIADLLRGLGYEFNPP